MSQPTNRTTPATTLAALASLPPITVGSRLTTYTGLDLQVAGMAQGGMGLVVWGPDAGRGGQMRAVKLPRPDRLAQAAAHSPDHLQQVLADFEREALIWDRATIRAKMGQLGECGHHADNDEARAETPTDFTNVCCLAAPHGKPSWRVRHRQTQH